MADLKTLVEREMDRAGEPTFAFVDLVGLRVRRHRTKQVTAAAVGLGLVLVLALVGASLYRGAEVPANPPDERAVDLGIFEPLAGKVVYWSDGSLWGVDPNAPSPVSTLVRVDLTGTAEPDELASFTIPLGWSSDGTELLFLREDPADQGFPYDRYLYILRADGTQTQVIAESVADAALSPDGTRVVFAPDGGGLYAVDPEGGQPVRINDVGESPTFSPDGTQIAYLSESSQAGIEHVWVANADGTDAHEILTDQALDMGMGKLTWSPASDLIAMENQQEGHVAIYTFAPDGSGFTKVITGGFNHSWSPDGTQIAYGLPGRDGVSVADADGLNARTLSLGAPGPWHPAAGITSDADGSDPTPIGFVGRWVSTDSYDYFGARSSAAATMTIRAGQGGAVRVTIEDDSGCTEGTSTMTGSGRLEEPATLVVAAPDLTCADGSDPADPTAEDLTDYTLVLEAATERLFDSRGVVWTRGPMPDSWADRPTESGVDGAGTFSILHGEVTFRAAEPWSDHSEAYIDPRVFFLLGPGLPEIEMTMLVNPLAPESCGPRVPPPADELVEAIRSNPNLETTAPVTERVGELDALRIDVIAAPGASLGPCTEGGGVDIVTVPGRPWANVGTGELARLYLLDLPGGSARTLAILITAPSATAFELAVDSAVPVLDSFEFHAP